MEVGGIGADTCGPWVKLHFGTSDVVFVSGKPHSSETAFPQALAIVTKVTFAFLEREVNTKVCTNLCRRKTLEQCNPARRGRCAMGLHKRGGFTGYRLCRRPFY